MQFIFLGKKRLVERHIDITHRAASTCQNSSFPTHIIFNTTTTTVIFTAIYVTTTDAILILYFASIALYFLLTNIASETR